MTRLIVLTSQTPASQIRMAAGTVAVGDEASLVVFDPNENTDVTHHHSLYKNEMLSGRVKMVVKGDEISRF